jgi:hypothetical protein
VLKLLVDRTESYNYVQRVNFVTLFTKDARVICCIFRPNLMFDFDGAKTLNKII